MAINEVPGFLKYKDAEGNLNLLLPITTKDNVDGMDEIETALEETVRFTEQTLTDEQKAQVRSNIGVAEVVTLEPAEDDIPKVFFGAALPQSKNDSIMSFRYISKTEDISGYCKTKAQGNSSMSFPKKNQTVKLYKDAACTEKLKVNFKGWGEQNKFCFKANWIDLTHARNIVSARLWGDVVKCRSNYEELPEELTSSPNQGAIDGFPVKVYAKGIYQGRYTINIPKDAWMANMDDELETHCILCGENYDSGCFRSEALIDGSDWSDEVHDVVPESIKTRWNDAINFIINSTDEEFVAGIGDYFDIQSLIDYYIFGLVICNMDGFGKNQLYHTYNGLKWYASVYDMDCVFGTYFSTILSTEYARTSYEDFRGDDRDGNLLYIRLEELFAEEIQQRYLELKSSALSLDNIINRFERFTDIAPLELVKEDYATTTAEGAFTDIPLQDENNIQQVRSYIVARYPYVENYIFGLGARGGLLYKLTSETTLDGVDDYIDTEVKLFNKAKDFTIICDATMLGVTETYCGVYTAYKNGNGDSSLDGGLQVCAITDNKYILTGSVCIDGSTVYTDTYAEITANKVKHAVVYNDGIPRIIYYMSDDGTVLNKIDIANGVYVAHDYTLVIGCRFGWYQNKEKFVPMTLHNFEIWDYAMTQKEVEENLGAVESESTGLLYKLPDETVFTGVVDDVVDTGLILYDKARDFTIVCDATLSDDAGDYEGVYTAYQNDNGGAKDAAGIQCVTQTEGQYTISAVHDDGNAYATFLATTNRIKHVAVVKQGCLDTVYYVTEDDGSITTFNPEGHNTYTAHSYPLQLGCMVGWYQSKAGFAPMTMHNFEVWGYAMQDYEAAVYLT